MDKKEKTIQDLRRVAAKLKTTRLSKKQYRRHGQVGVTTVRNRFGSWNEAVTAAGLEINPPSLSIESGRPRISDEELLREIVRLTEELGKQPSRTDMDAKGRFSSKPYNQRWGSFPKARETAYARYGQPRLEAGHDKGAEKASDFKGLPTRDRMVIAETFKPRESVRRKKIRFGEPIDFRGLRFAPINEQGVVYLFGMISKELGFLIESVRTEYTDCEGKRCVDQQEQRWEHVRIEFEYKSSDFRDHGHSAERCDLIVCWFHNWRDCPIEVLELSSQIKSLPSR